MIRVGVARGGPGQEYDISLKEGESILRTLRSLPSEFSAVDILVTKDGTWHISGLPARIDSVKDKIDVLWNSLHGQYGEDGELANILRASDILHTGTHGPISELALNKILSKDKAKEFGLKVPPHIAVSDDTLENDQIDSVQKAEKLALEVHQHFAPPWIVKPVFGGYSIDASYASSLPALVDILIDAYEKGNSFIVEQYIPGREVVSGFIRDFRNTNQYHTFPLEVKNGKPVLDYKTRFSDSQSYTLLRDHEDIKKKIKEFTEYIDKNVNLGKYATADWILTPKGLYFLELDAQPEMHESSALAQAAKQAGISYAQLIKHLVFLAKNEK